jgi:predicted transcriptional regulator of viral defense system
MRLVDMLSRLKALDQAVVRTADVMACFNISKSNASKAMSRLADSGHLLRIKRGLWAFQGNLDPMKTAEALTAPFPSYISLQSALHYHGVITQIPAVTFSVSTARTQFFCSPLGVFSIHHIAPSFFFGYEPVGTKGILMATPEKAICDFLYLSPARSRLFHALPETDLAGKLNMTTVRRIISRVPSRARRTLVETRFVELQHRSSAIPSK